MSGNAMSSVIEAEMDALAFHEAAWQAYERRHPSPDPLLLSDDALRAIAAYGDEDLPRAVVLAVEREIVRREPWTANRRLAIAALAILGVSGIAIGGVLLAT